MSESDCRLTPDGQYFNHIMEKPSSISMIGDRRGRMVVRFTTTVQSVPITTNVVSSNPAQDEVYNIM
jgi:Ni,Fe-hydrogenase III large subunit